MPLLFQVFVLLMGLAVSSGIIVTDPPPIHPALLHIPSSSPTSNPLLLRESPLNLPMQMVPPRSEKLHVRPPWINSPPRW